MLFAIAIQFCVLCWLYIYFFLSAVSFGRDVGWDAASQQFAWTQKQMDLPPLIHWCSSPLGKLIVMHSKSVEWDNDERVRLYCDDKFVWVVLLNISWICYKWLCLCLWRDTEISIRRRIVLFWFVYCLCFFYLKLFIFNGFIDHSEWFWCVLNMATMD